MYIVLQMYFKIKYIFPVLFTQLSTVNEIIKVIIVGILFVFIILVTIYLQKKKKFFLLQLKKEEEVIKALTYHVIKMFKHNARFPAFQKIQHSCAFKPYSLVNISKILANKIKLFHLLAIIKKIHLSYICTESLYLRTNHVMFQKMITILLYNIFTCTGENGRIRVIVKETHTKILLHIKVHGPGITEERIKEKFLSICNLGENNIQSRGTMLFFIRHFIDSIQGKIKIKRKPDNRVIVSLIFPKGEKPGIKQIKQTTVKLPDTGMAKKLPEGSYEKEKQTVFILESNKDTIININKCMKSYYNIFHATNGEEALDKIKRIPKPDIIISNINMKKMNGYEFYHHLLKDEKFKDIPVFFLDTLTNKQEKIKAIKKGIIDVIDKPFHMEEFVEKVRSFLENRKVFIELQRKRIEEKISILLRRNGDDEFLQFEKKCILYRISPREKNILRELLRGLQTKEIAVKYYLSTHTVKKHIRMIYKKCNVQNRVELVNCFKN